MRHATIDIGSEKIAKLEALSRRSFIPSSFVELYWTAPPRARYWSKKKRRQWVRLYKALYGRAVMPWRTR